MGKNRAERLAELIKEEVSDIILREVKDPRIGFVSVTDVEVSGDLRHANVYVSVYGSDKEREDTMEGLKKGTGFIRKLLGDRITVYHTPEILFKYDDSIEHGAHISRLIDKIKKDRKE
ncbi:MAG: 30S ribosome-binding factor RbfA [Halothermotrichaceae bacterium]